MIAVTLAAFYPDLTCVGLTPPLIYNVTFPLFPGDGLFYCLYLPVTVVTYILFAFARLIPVVTLHLCCPYPAPLQIYPIAPPLAFTCEHLIVVYYQFYIYRTVDCRPTGLPFPTRLLRRC